MTSPGYMSPIEQPDSNDLLRMSAPKLRELARRDGLPRIAGAVRHVLRGIIGRPGSHWPPSHLAQSGDYCQTVALANGVRCHQAANRRPLWSPDLNTLEGIRLAIIELDLHPLSVTDVAEVLKLSALTGKPLLRTSQVMQHPVVAARQMADKGFAVLVDGRSRTASAVVPNVAGRLATAGIAPEFIKISPYRGNEAGLSAEGFCREVLAQDIGRGDATVVCNVA